MQTHQTFIDRIGTEYNLARKWLKALNMNSQDGNEYSEEEDGTFLVRMYAYSSFVDDRLNEKIHELFMPSIFVTVYKLLDEILIYIYESSMEKDINPRMGYEKKSNIFKGKAQEFKGEVYDGLDKKKVVSKSHLGIMCNEEWLDRIIDIHAKLREKRNALIHSNNFEIKTDRLVFNLRSSTEELMYEDIICLLQISLYTIDQIVYEPVTRKKYRMEYYYNKLSFIEQRGECENIFFDPRLLDTIILNVTPTEDGYRTNYHSIEERVMKSRFQRRVDYISFTINDDTWLIPRADIVERKISLEKIHDLSIFDDFKNKSYKDFEELRAI
ncbi:hypothetical protein [Parageobacillus toebii]|uniref:hypothetical protein n=1 Tax=Parageobacillus toebii TaxID=153151 RepID=UPI00196833FA|nr:hypothetical protein [Parageobacillus toebii]QSB49348.1 hypothetical protein JTI59_03330 [Parageobacillus toebii]